ncbi:hypothetical protein F511_13105 [Dorcoceras hygrometricum]|uniref:Uncharacterized protein n=1 Tax=Dorcoceras hygrometricum TaxID=472368 RepID=A0A2Z7AZY2_9LAMI|nr:hypothetical protein F511_13105 [Dorcoceras hygrometricum]
MTVLPLNSGKPRTCVTLNGSGIQLAVGPQPLRLRNHNSGLVHRIMVKRLATSPHDPLGITDSACKNQLVVVSVQYGHFNPYIPIRSTTIGKSRVAIDPIAMHTSWRLNSDIASVSSIGYPRMSASGESSTTMHRLLHASGSHPIPTPYDPKSLGYVMTMFCMHTFKGNNLIQKDNPKVDFQSVLVMEHTEMARIFKTQEDIGIIGFLAASSSLYDSVVVEFFANPKVIAGTIVNLVANRKLVLTKETFAEAFGLPTKGMTSFLDISNQTMVEMCGRFSGSDVSFRAPSKKKEMKMEFRLFHYIVAKVLCAKDGSFDMVTSEKFDLMVAITVGLKVNWAQVLFQVLVAMVHNPSHQSQGFAVQLSVLLERLVKGRPRGVCQVAPSKANRQRIHQSGTEGGKSHMTKPVENKREKTEKAAVEKPKKMKETMIKLLKTREVVVQQSMEAGRQVTPTKSKSGTSSDKDSCTLERLKNHVGKIKQVVESSHSEATVFVPPMPITKKHMTKRTKKVPPTNDHEAETQPDSVSAGVDKGSTTGEPEATLETLPELEKRAGDESTARGPEGHVGTPPEIEGRIDSATSNADEQEEHMERGNQAEKNGPDENVSTTSQGEHEGSTAEMETEADNQEYFLEERHICPTGSRISDLHWQENLRSH